MKILLSNDDGINAIGLRALYTALVERGHTVFVVAPISEQSAASSRLTIRDPMRIKSIHEDNFHGVAVAGTPADCVLVGLKHLYTTPETRPDLVVSGINAGHNIGFDVLYSGTVAAAHEGTLAGIPSIAVSRWKHPEDDPYGVARITVDIIESVDWQAISERRTWNLNFPPRPCKDMKGVKVCPLSRASWDTRYEQRQDPRGEDYLWMCNVPFPYEDIKDAEGTDVTFLQQGYITLTPLLTDFTDNAILNSTKEKIEASTACESNKNRL